MAVLTIEEFARRLRRGETSSLAATEACLDQIEARDRRLNAFILVMTESARRQARLADRELSEGRDRGPLHGVPISLKDLFDVEGLATTAASRVRQEHVASSDAPVVGNLRRAGAVIIGKTNLHEFAFGTTSEDSAFGPVRNPYDESRSPGGSSGGSAVSLVAGMALGTIGTDTGGSIRIPAAACGLVGLKPTAGEVPTGGVVPLSKTMDHVGPLAHTVSDAWQLLNGLLDRSSSQALQPLAPTRSLSNVHLGVPRRYFCDVLDNDVRSKFEDALDALRVAGASIDDVEIHNAEHIAAVYLHLVLGDAAAYHAFTLETMPERYTPPVRERLEMGRYVLAEDYVRALNGRAALTHQVDAALAERQALILPTLPIVAPPIGAAVVPAGSVEQPVRNLMLRLTQLFNLTGHPAVSLPCGSSSQGLPCGIQLVGARGETENLLRLALSCEHLLTH